MLFINVLSNINYVFFKASHKSFYILVNSNLAPEASDSGLPPIPGIMPPIIAYAIISSISPPANGF
jgi:hypothetical protein